MYVDKTLSHSVPTVTHLPEVLARVLHGALCCYVVVDLTSGVDLQVHLVGIHVVRSLVQLDSSLII